MRSAGWQSDEISVSWPRGSRHARICTGQRAKGVFSIDGFFLIIGRDSEQFVESPGAKPMFTVVRIRDGTVAIVDDHIPGQSAEYTGQI